MPVVDPTAFVHPTAVLIGDVRVGPGCYVGPCASLRGDFGRLVLEAGVNVQDTCVLHGFPGTDTVVEADGHIGHGAVLHGCVVRRDALVGMNAVVMDEAEVGEQAIVAACAFVRAGMKVPPRMLVAGVPGKVVRELTRAGDRVEARRHPRLPGPGAALPCLAARGGAAGSRRPGAAAADGRGLRAGASAAGGDQALSVSRPRPSSSRPAPCPCAR